MPERNPITRAVLGVLQGLIRLYRFFLSPFVGRQCRFYPTCSSYAQEALERHGPIKGLFLTGARVCSCHPWSGRHGLDPVPDQFEWRSLMRYKRGIPNTEVNPDRKDETLSP